MKEIDPLRSKIETKAEKQEQKKAELIGRIKPCGGHTCYEYEIATGNIKEAEFMLQTVNYAEYVRTRHIQKKILVKAGHLYVTALNAKNALKKFKKMLSE